MNQIYNCIRCDSINIIANPFVINCNNCNCQSFYNGVQNVLSVKFNIENIYVRINYTENKTYLNMINHTQNSMNKNDLILDFSLPSNIQESKLKSYIKLYLFS